MKTTILTPYDCLIKTENQEFFLARNDRCSLEEIGTIYVYPTADKMSFVIKEQYSPFYCTVEKENIRYIFLLDGVSVQNVEIHNASFVGGTGKIEKHPDKIIFCCKDHKKIIPLFCRFDEIIIDSSFHIGYVFLSSAKSNYLVFFNFKNGRCKVFEGEKINYSPPNFEIVCKDKNISLTISKEGLKQKGKQNVAILENPLFPYLPFVQGLKEENYSFCHSLLSENLQETQTENNIKAFFGHVEQFFPLSHNQVFILSENKGEIYSFSYANGKICDISTE